MFFNLSRNQTSRYGLVIFLILALFLCAVFFFVRTSKTSALSDHIDRLVRLRENYSQVDTVVALLYKADNNCRLFAATGQRSYLRSFSNDIRSASQQIDSLNQLDERTAHTGSSPEELHQLISRKEVRMQLFVKLRKLTDSLISSSAQIDTGLASVKPAPRSALNFKRLNTTVAVDTIKEAVQPEKNKKLFGRIVDAFANKKKTGQQADTSKKIVRTATEMKASVSQRQLEEQQYKQAADYFRKLYAVNSQLKQNEIQVLAINNRLIAEMLAVLDTYKTQEKQFVTQAKAGLQKKIQYTFRSIDHMFVLSMAILVLMLAIILFNLWKMYKNEHKLISFGERASEYALAKSRFLANMSHEIRTPLNSVIGFSEQLSQTRLNNDQTEQLNAIRSSSIMLLDLVNDILDFSKYETYKVSFDKLPFKPYEAIHDVVSNIGIQASQKGVALNTKLAFDKHTCFAGDSLRLKQVLMNLLSNAIKFTEQGSVTLIAEVTTSGKKQGVLQVQVIDTGIGIAPKDLALIFDEFAQVNSSSARFKHKGTGLGLAICKKIIEFQGGEISLTSKVDRGSTFSFSVPYEILDAQAQQATQAKKLDFSPLAGKRVLVADDNRMNVLLAKTVIAKYKMHTDVAHDGEEAFALFTTNTYDLVLTDIQMPKMNGIALTKAIRAHSDKQKQTVPVLGVTANVLPEDRQLYLAAGMNDLVLKPYSENELIEKIAAQV